MEYLVRCPKCRTNNELPQLLNPFIRYCCYCGAELDDREVADRVATRREINQTVQEVIEDVDKKE